MKVFIDTSAFIALFVAKDENHSPITRQYSTYRKQRALFFTSDYILDELFTRLMYDFGKGPTLKVLSLIKQAIANEELNVLHIDNIVFQKSKDIFLKYADHRISFTDATSFQLFRDFALDEIFTLDSDFKKMRLKTAP